MRHGTSHSPHSMPNNTAVVCRGISKVFGEGATRVAALRGVDLDVRAGEMTLLVGPSGCGKTTLLSVIAGILDPTEGNVWVLGHDLGAMPQRDVVKFRGENIGFVFQQFNLLPALTAVENAAVPLIINGMPRRKAVDRAAELLDVLGLSRRSKAFPAEMSGGEQQRVAIARALTHNPRLLVCDEPTSALDAKNGHLIMEKLHETAVHPDRAVIVVTHDSRIFEFGGRIARMEDGRVISTEEQQHRPKPAAIEAS